MKVLATGLPGCVVVEPDVHADDRGHFLETFHVGKLADAGVRASIQQANLSFSRGGVLRGLHYQWPKPQAKYVSVLEGEAWDVAVDIRRGSPHFGKWTAVLLSAGNRRHFWIPEGFAHGFVVVGDHALVSYLCTATYDAAADANIRWDDADLAIDWPVASPQLSGKDAKAPFLADVPQERLPLYVP